MSKLWETSAWRKKRAELIKGKSCEWCDSKEFLVIDHLYPPNTQTDEDYLSFKDVIILCRRCAYARLKGMRLCPKCKKKYVYGNFKQCFDCLPDSEWKNEIKSKNEIIEITFPCGLKTEMRREESEEEEICDACPKGIYFGECVIWLIANGYLDEKDIERIKREKVGSKNES